MQASASVQPKDQRVSPRPPAPPAGTRHDQPSLSTLEQDVLVACPDARAPAYQAVVALEQTMRLRRFVTGFYFAGGGPLSAAARKIAPRSFSRVERQLLRRHERGIPADKVRGDWGFDLALSVEKRLAASHPALRRQLARWRTRHFDQVVTRALSRDRPRAAFLFSDVASEFALPACRRLGIASVLSMVHGDVREERRVMEIEASESPDFFPIYLGNGEVDNAEMAWLHERRLRDIELADRILVPSEHIASELARHGTERHRIDVVPYAADTERFRPNPGKVHSRKTCKFLFAGGITQRKGIKYLLEAWKMIRRPGWTLQLLGALPANTGPLEPFMGDIQWLGRFPHSEVPGRMASADVFVFPSLFEGSAVVTYEALACGLPCIVTSESGSIVRHGRDGLVVPSRDVDALAAAMERLGADPGLRADCAGSARLRAEAHDWNRYHEAVNAAVSRVMGEWCC